MACDADTLLAEARCLQCSLGGSMFDAVEVALLCAIRDGDTTMACDPDALLAEANCLLCKIPPGAFEAVKVKLLCDIASGGGGGGGAQEVYIGRDPLPPDDPTKPALNFPAGGGTLTQWDVGSASWV